MHELGTAMRSRKSVAHKAAYTMFAKQAEGAEKSAAVAVSNFHKASTGKEQLATLGSTVQNPTTLQKSSGTETRKASIFFRFSGTGSLVCE